MRLPRGFFCLPTTVLLLLVSHTSAKSPEPVYNVSEQPQRPDPKQWPWNLPSHVRYWPEDPPYRRRDLEAREEHLRLGRNPIEVMKMSGNIGEKFWPEYWGFEDGPFYTAPFALHLEDNAIISEAVRARNIHTGRDTLAVLKKRQAQCPTGTSDCSGIGYPNSCCGIGETCTQIQDTGLGPVGCCPSTGCTGAVTSCASPNTPCAASLGGGCCIPDFVCSGAICVIDPSLIVTSTITIVFTVQPSLSSTITTTILSTLSLSSSSTTTTTTTATTSCAASFQSCPATLGGGCCPTDRVCGTSSLCPLSPGSTESTTSSTPMTSTSQSTASATNVVPVRPTGITSSSMSLQPTGTACPTGFYACDAYYAGGCCMTGRDCHSTSCPAMSSVTVVTEGRTIVVPIGAAATVSSLTGSCATGWSSCAASVGGGCCLTGWDCGTASCSSVGSTNTAVAQKENPSSGAAFKASNWSAAVGVAFVCALVVI